MKPGIPYTATLSGKSTLLAETFAILRELDLGRTVAEVKSLVMAADLLGKLTQSTRKSVWDHLHTRYLGDEARAATLARMVTRTPDRQTAHLVLLFEMCRSLPVLRDAVVGCVYPRYAAGFSGVSKADLQRFFDASADSHPELITWSPQTRDKVVSNILTILRDLGLLTGSQSKQFARLYVPLPAFVYVLYRLAGDGVSTAQGVLAHEDWRLFLFESADVQALLAEASAAGYCTFKVQGDVYSLDLRFPSLEACVESLTGEVRGAGALAVT
jgi:hypothetical protein